MSNLLPQLCFPKYDFKLKNNNNKIYIFDELRNKWIICTPEEWVRQNLIKFMTTNLQYPRNLIAIEKSLCLAGKNYRFDALLYNRDFSPLIIIECKAPSVNLTQKVFDQIWNYNYEINSPFFIITNGVSFIMGKCTKNSGISFFEKTYSFEELVDMI